MEKRAEYSKDAHEVGDAAESFFNDFLEKKMKPDEFIWYNRKGDSFKKWDFAFLKNRKVVALAECESKDAEYKGHYERDGLDFLASKVERKYPFTCYYVMPISDRSCIFYLTMEEIKERGFKLRKDNIRQNNEGFYRVPLDKCDRIDFI